MADPVSIVAIGAATQDIFLTGKALVAKRDVRSKDFVEQFPLGAKIDIEGVHFDTGGGATNAAVTFARQGLKAAFMGKVGRDPAGAEVLRVLRREGIAAGHVAYDGQLATGYTTILVATNGERTILSYRGASHNLQAKDFAIRNLTADWLYITNLAGNLNLLGRLLKHANTRGMKVAFNPGQAEIKQGRKLKRLLPMVSILMANRQELAQLFGGDSVKAVIANAATSTELVVLTDGPAGSYVCDGEFLYSAGQYQKVKVVDRTGAGDAFCSGFVTAIARGDSIEDAITLGSANSTSVVRVVGAKPGILRGGKLKRMKIKKVGL